MFAGNASHFGFGLSQSTFESVDIEETLDGRVLAPSRGQSVDMMKWKLFDYYLLVPYRLKHPIDDYYPLDGIDFEVAKLLRLK